MTANEARARLNMPSLSGYADELVTPLNVLTGGQANPQDSAAPKSAPLTLPSPDGRGIEETRAVKRLDPTRGKLRAG